MVCQPARNERDHWIGAVHIRRIWDKYAVPAPIPYERAITFQIPRVREEVLARTELGRIDEDRDYDQVGLAANIVYESEMALVEISHGWHQADRLA
jgi:hypothetical protein